MSGAAGLVDFLVFVFVLLSALGFLLRVFGFPDNPLWGIYREHWCLFLTALAVTIFIGDRMAHYPLSLWLLMAVCVPLMLYYRHLTASPDREAERFAAGDTLHKRGEVYKVLHAFPGGKYLLEGPDGCVEMCTADRVGNFQRVQVQVGETGSVQAERSADGSATYSQVQVGGRNNHQEIR